MVRSPRERLLLTLVWFCILGAGGWFAGRQLYDLWIGIDEEIEQQHTNLTRLQKDRLEKASIEGDYNKTQSQLTIDKSEAAQVADFRTELQNLLQGAGLSVREFGQQERPRIEDDFKVLLVEVTDVQGTPEQLGTFLYNLENESNVMDVEQLTVNADTGGRARFGRGGGALSMNMRVARLVEYSTPELQDLQANKSRGRRPRE
ncbi:MAG TPA: GspMb/PilO family protein [bacterium]|nr:GspMb/PilO family protein [bacterium]HPO07187.1 GspMb/PilO family protein [bacterium]HQP98878.1 GspMb/PilO family protein [bacterium]